MKIFEEKLRVADVSIDSVQFDISIPDGFDAPQGGEL